MQTACSHTHRSHPHAGFTPAEQPQRAHLQHLDKEETFCAEVTTGKGFIRSEVAKYGKVTLWRQEWQGYLVQKVMKIPPGWRLELRPVTQRPPALPGGERPPTSFSCICILEMTFTSKWSCVK